MIYLNGNIGSVDGETTVYMFLADNCTLSDPFFTFRLYNKQSQQEIIFAVTDIGEDRALVSQFLIKVTNSSPILSLGELSASAGQYDYEVYESEYPGELVLADCVGIVKKGILEITGQVEEIRVIQEYPETIKVSNI